MPDDVLQLSARMQATVDSLLSFARARSQLSQQGLARIDFTAPCNELLGREG
jgi:hypothetical protein